MVTTRLHRFRYTSKINKENIIDDKIGLLNKNNINSILEINPAVESCFEGEILRLVKKIYDNNICDAIIVFYSLINQSDIDRYVGLYNVKFKVELARGDIFLKWKEMIDQYSQYELSTIIAIVSPRGEIIKYYYPGCKCSQEMVAYLNNVAKERKVK